VAPAAWTKKLKGTEKGPFEVGGRVPISSILFQKPEERKETLGTGNGALVIHKIREKK